MKNTRYLLLLCLLVQSNLFAQDLTITIGRGPDCLGRGACDISAEKNATKNAEIITKNNGKIILRLFRKNLSRDEQNRILNQPITSVNQGSLKFQLENDLTISEKIKSLLPYSISNKLHSIKAKSYATEITPEFIDILIID